MRRTICQMRTFIWMKRTPTMVRCPSSGEDENRADSSIPGARIGHRSLQRYYRQHLRLENEKEVCIYSSSTHRLRCQWRCQHTSTDGSPKQSNNPGSAQRKTGVERHGQLQGDTISPAVWSPYWSEGKQSPKKFPCGQSDIDISNSSSSSSSSSSKGSSRGCFRKYLINCTDNGFFQYYYY